MRIGSNSSLGSRRKEREEIESQEQSLCLCLTGDAAGASEAGCTHTGGGCPKHMDAVPGDRASSRGGVMEPIGMKYKRGKGLQVVHRCLTCGGIRVNRIARDTAQTDDVELLLRLAVF